jgi:hypothetical protein
MISEISSSSCNDLQRLRMPTVLCHVLCLTFVSGFDSFRAHHPPQDVSEVAIQIRKRRGIRPRWATGFSESRKLRAAWGIRTSTMVGRSRWTPAPPLTLPNGSKTWTGARKVSVRTFCFSALYQTLVFVIRKVRTFQVVLKRVADRLRGASGSLHSLVDRSKKLDAPRRAVGEPVVSRL